MNFDQMEKRYRELVAQRQAGLLGPRQFEDLVAGLRLQDAQHRWWQLDPASGQWLTWNGSNWQTFSWSWRGSVGFTFDFAD